MLMHKQKSCIVAYKKQLSEDNERHLEPCSAMLCSDFKSVTCLEEHTSLGRFEEEIGVVIFNAGVRAIVSNHA